MSNHTGICIVWPAYFEGSTDKESHCTALFLGSTETANFTKDQVEHAIWPVSHIRKVIPTNGVAMFGANADVPVILLNDAGGQLGLEYSVMKHQLTEAGIPYSDLYDFNPHVTVANDNPGAPIPTEVHLTAPVVWWGDERKLHPAHQSSTAAVA